MANIVFLSNVRISFPQLVEAKASVQPSPENPNPKKKFSVDCILTPDNPSFAKFMVEVQVIMAAKWADKAPAILNMINADRKLRCYGKGDEKVGLKSLAVHPGYAGNLFIGANNEDRPQMIRPDGSPVESSNQMEQVAIAKGIYGGCYANVAVSPWLQDNVNGRAVRCNLVAIQFLKDGEALGEAAADASAMFGAVAAPAVVFPGFMS
jgi:hypothetical protein